MKASVAVLAGDGIGPEVIAEGLRCLRTIAGLFGHEFELAELPFGGAAIESHADPLPERTLSACLAADAVLLGAIGGPQRAAPPAPPRPQAGPPPPRAPPRALAHPPPREGYPAPPRPPPPPQGGPP